jgi:hypothetical protein
MCKEVSQLLKDLRTSEDPFADAHGLDVEERVSITDEAEGFGL